METIVMKKLLLLILALTITFTACNNDGIPSKGELQMSEQTQRIINFLNCEYTLLKSTERTPNALYNMWKDLYEQGQSEGFYPLFILTRDGRDFAEQLEYANNHFGTSQDILKTADTLDVFDVFKKYYKDWYDDFATEEGFVSTVNNDNVEVAFRGFGGTDELFVAKIPVDNPWELAAYIPMGGWNECPTPAEQVVVFKHWYENHGAIPVFVTYDTWTLFVSKPITTDEEALVVAKEQLAFCSDLIEPGLGYLASSIKDSSGWGFWWD